MSTISAGSENFLMNKKAKKDSPYGRKPYYYPLPLCQLPTSFTGLLEQNLERVFKPLWSYQLSLFSHEYRGEWWEAGG